MKNIALIATTLALLSAGVNAQEKSTEQRQVKVTVGSVVTLYSWPAANPKYTVTSLKATVNETKHEYEFEGDVVIQLGSSLKIHADKAMIKANDSGYPSIFLQSEGKVESQDGEHKVTQFASSGTSIEFVRAK